MISLPSKDDGKVEKGVVKFTSSSRTIHQGNNIVTALETIHGKVYRVVLQPDDNGYYREIQIVPTDARLSGQIITY